MKKFPWGLVLEEMTFDFDGEVFEVTKYLPKKCSPHTGPEETPSYHCQEIHRSSDSLKMLLIYWLTFKQLGNNQDQLARGIGRALEIKD